MTKRYGMWSAILLTAILSAMAYCIYRLTHSSSQPPGLILLSLCATLLVQALRTYNVLELRNASQLRLRYFNPFKNSLEFPVADLQDVKVIKRTTAGGSTYVKIGTHSGARSYLFR